MLKFTKILFTFCLISIVSLGVMLYIQYKKIEAQKKEIELHSNDIQSIENQIDLSSVPYGGYENQDINEKVHNLELQIEDLESKINDLESKINDVQYRE